MSSFTRQRWIGLSLFLLLSALAIWLQARWFGAMLRLSFLTGWILFALILALTFYNGRKKLPFVPLLSSEAWLQFHIYAGLLTGVLSALPIVSAGAEAPASPAATPPAQAETPRASSGRLLVLDDEQMIAELLGEMLGLLGYSTTLCHSASEALQLVAQHDFDLIISDFRMPKMNGQEFYCQAIAVKPDLARRILFLTGDVVSEETQAFLQSTGNPHLSKPFQLARVEQVVAEVLRSRLANS